MRTTGATWLPALAPRPPRRGPRPARGAGLGERGPADWLAAFRQGVEGVRQRGKAEPGDKTMLDALLPAVQAMQEALAAGLPLPDMLWRAEQAAKAGMEGTIPLQARKGRASYLGERSIGPQAPGGTPP